MYPEHVASALKEYYELNELQKQITKKKKN